MRRLLIVTLALGLMACQTPGQPTVKQVKPKAKPSSSASTGIKSSSPPNAASTKPSTSPSSSASASVAPGDGASPTPTLSPELSLTLGDQTSDSWIAGPSLQRGRAGLAAGSLGEDLLAIEGDHRPSIEVLSAGTVAWAIDYSHDGALNPASTRTLTSGLRFLLSGVRSDALYTAGGAIGSGTIPNMLRYNKNGFQEAASTLNVPVKASAGGVIGDVFVVAGGVAGNGSLVDTVAAVNVLNGDLTAKTAMPKAVAGAASAVVGTKLYVLGGYDLSGGGTTPLTTVQVFDMATSQWTSSDGSGATKPAPLSVARHSAGAAVLDGKIYLVGGAGSSGLIAPMAIYDPATNAWTAGASLPTPRSLLAVAAHKNRLWTMGGMNKDGRTMTTVEVYRP